MKRKPLPKAFSEHWQGVSMLVAVCAIWGSSFIVVKDAVVDVPPSVLIFVRFALSALLFLPFVSRNRQLIRAGLELGFWAIGGYGMQAIGLQYTSVSRSAFITSLCVILLPLFSLILGRRVGALIWVAALLAIVGVGLLSSDGSPPNLGDFWTLGTATFFAFYIWRLETYSLYFNVSDLAGAQLWGATLLSLPWVLATHPHWLKLTSLMQLPWIPVLYLAIVCTACTTWMQTWGQQRVNATQAAIVFTLEPVWASIFALMFIGEQLGIQGLFGAALIVSATIISQFASRAA